MTTIGNTRIIGNEPPKRDVTWTYGSVEDRWNSDRKYHARMLENCFSLNNGEDQDNVNLPLHVRQKVFAGKMKITNTQHGDPTPWRDQAKYEHAKIQASRWTSAGKRIKSLRPHRIESKLVEAHNMERKVSEATWVFSSFFFLVLWFLRSRTHSGEVIIPTDRTTFFLHFNHAHTFLCSPCLHSLLTQ